LRCSGLAAEWGFVDRVGVGIAGRATDEVRAAAGTVFVDHVLALARVLEDADVLERRVHAVPDDRLGIAEGLPRMGTVVTVGILLDDARRPDHG
jgi:hypothetical protein